jgi:ribosomal protein S18 acetylase RimI-like enzyme
MLAQPIVVRCAKKSELRIAAVLFRGTLMRLSFYNSLAKKNESKKYTTDKLVANRAKDPYSVLVAVDGDGRIVGICFSHFDDYTIWIDWFSVRPSFRGKGVGRALVDAVLKTARMRSAHKVWCDTRATNEPSKNLLHKSGFRMIAEVRRHWYKQDFILWEKLA